MRPGTHGHNLIVKVVSTNVVLEKTRIDGSKIRIAEAVLGDETGCVTLTARNGTLFGDFMLSLCLTSGFIF